jgi:micrococcal nuclease
VAYGTPFTGGPPPHLKSVPQDPEMSAFTAIARGRMRHGDAKRGGRSAGTALDRAPVRPARARLLVTATAGSAAPCPRGILTGEVTHVRDGDTIVIGDMPIRLNGLAVPEWDELGGAEATRAMVEVVDGRPLRCEFDGERTRDRCVGVRYLEGADMAAEMARDCLGTVAGGIAISRRKPQRPVRRSGGLTGCRGIAGGR